MRPEFLFNCYLHMCHGWLIRNHTHKIEINYMIRKIFKFFNSDTPCHQHLGSLTERKTRNNEKIIGLDGEYFLKIILRMKIASCSGWFQIWFLVRNFLKQTFNFHFNVYNFNTSRKNTIIWSWLIESIWVNKTKYPAMPCMTSVPLFFSCDYLYKLLLSCVYKFAYGSIRRFYC